jgi:leucyl aminopeptidase (aminopeptidase T)
MDDLFYDQCYAKVIRTKFNLDLPVKSKSEMKDIVLNSTLGSVEKDLETEWTNRETVAIDEIKGNADSDSRIGKDENPDEWRLRINKRREAAKKASEARINKAFEEMYNAGRNKSVAEQEALFTLWDIFEAGLKVVWKSLIAFFKKVVKWLKEAWNTIYGYISDTLNSIKDAFLSIFGEII